MINSFYNIFHFLSVRYKAVVWAGSSEGGEGGDEDGAQSNQGWPLWWHIG